jgi:hypothetical protein
VRRLTRTEYNNTIRDLLGDTSAPASSRDFSDDQLAELSGFLRGGSISATDVNFLLDTTDRLTLTAIGHLSQIVPCNPIPAAAADQATCAQQFIHTFGRRAYRRPLLPEEEAALFALYQAQSAPDIAADFPNAIRAVLAGMLQSPSFLYRWELGPQKPIVEGALIRFNQYEIASRLSYFFWSSMPDNALFDAADAGQLSTPEQIEQQARRMLADPKASDGIADFHSQWLELRDLANAVKDPMLYPSFGPALVTSMLTETQQFVVSVLGPQGDGRLQTLLTSPNSFVDANLAKLYGLANFTGQGFQRVALDPAQRSGVFTQASFLATQSTPTEGHPIKRGARILRRLLCIDMQPPQNVAIPQPAPPTPTTTIRARYADHAANPCATSCHQLIDPPGFAFLNYDSIGAWMATDAGQPVDASGSLAVGSKQIVFHDAVDMLAQLAQADEVRDCMAKQWLRYLTRRGDIPGDSGSLAATTSAFRSASFDIRELMVALTKTNAMTHRIPSPGEVTQ